MANSKKNDIFKQQHGDQDHWEVDIQMWDPSATVNNSQNQLIISPVSGSLKKGTVIGT